MTASTVHSGKIVVVTGASSGIGRVTALTFARRGATVIGVARREPQLRQLAEECRALAGAADFLCGDLGERSFAERVVDDTVERHGRIDVLVNNAAISKHKQIHHMTADEADQVMRVNFMSCVWTTLAALPPMLRQGGGTIVNVSSFGGRVSPPREAIYAASKAAMNSFTEGLWIDLAGTNIHAGLVIPGAIDTEIWQKEDEPPAFDGKKFPPEIVADAIVEVVEKRIHEVTVPRHNLSLMSARALRLVAPAVLRMGMNRMEPVPPEVVDRARERARRGKRNGDLSEG